MVHLILFYHLLIALKRKYTQFYISWTADITPSSIHLYSAGCANDSPVKLTPGNS